MDPSSVGDNVRRLWEMTSPCTLCPRRCRIDRMNQACGYCGVGSMPRISSIIPHFGEERVLVGSGGSGTIFLAGCNLRCLFCQNHDISHDCHGKSMTVEQLASAMALLQEQGCANINFVTPTHVIAPIAEAIELARRCGLTIPTVYNTGGYDSVETLKQLDGLIDIYMPDLKYADAKVAETLSDAPDYPRISFAAAREMHRQVGDLKIESGLARRGLLVRHLVLPEGLAGSGTIIDFLADEISPQTAINVMDQYHPCYHAHLQAKVNRRPRLEEIDTVRRYARERGLTILD